jgi:glyoxylase-like metal-dependent hydrolase (beta-lactamase superfamily II)
LDKFLSFPDNIYFLERGWLSANQILLPSDSYLDVVDSGFCTHISQTTQLIHHHLKGRESLQTRFLVNTHLHSDHCGGNASLTETFGFKVLVPFAEFDAVQEWDKDKLGFNDLGQPCPNFSAFGVYHPNTTIRLGDYDWEVHQAKGHDNEAQILFNPEFRLLISGDALWEKGFGALFPDALGHVNFAGAAATLELIHGLNPAFVLPGHGNRVSQVESAIHFALERLQYLSNHPERNLLHVCNVLLKFKLIEWQQIPLFQAQEWFTSTPMLERIANFLQMDTLRLFQETCNALERSQVLLIKNSYLYNV